MGCLPVPQVLVCARTADEVYEPPNHLPALIPLPLTPESTGVLPPEVLFEQALGILREKAEQLAAKL